MNRASIEHEVWDVVVALNRLWARGGDPARLVDYFAPEMIAITPTDTFRREGQMSCVAGWTDFVRASRILRWEEKNPKVLVLADGRCAVVAYDFDIDFETNGHLIEMRGRDLMTFEKRANRWWLVADMFAPAPA
jgi:ketosteroid isomerase-like protein